MYSNLPDVSEEQIQLKYTTAEEMVAIYQKCSKATFFKQGKIGRYDICLCLDW